MRTGKPIFLLLYRNVLSKVLDRQFLQCAILLQLREGIVQRLHQVVLTLADREGRRGADFGLCRDLHIRVRLLLEIVQHGELVVQRDIGTTGGNGVNRLREVIDRDDVRAILLGRLIPVAGLGSPPHSYP